MITTTEKECRKALTPTGGFLAGYTHSAQPYEGCGLGAEDSCPFCYMRVSQIQNYAPLEWGAWVRAKVNFPQALQQELREAKRRGALESLRVFMSSASDPWQPAEARYGLTRAALEVWARYPIGVLVLQTRATLVRRDLGLIREIPRVILNITIETDREDVARALTPRTSRPAARIKVAREARGLGIPVQATVSPLLPCDPENLAALLDDAVDRVVFDTLQLGDGASGYRSKALGMAKLLEPWGADSTWDPGVCDRALETLRRRLGETRVLLSQAGFADTALVPAAPVAQPGLL